MHSSGSVSWLIWLLLAIIFIWLLAEVVSWGKKRSNPVETGGSTSKALTSKEISLQYNRLLFPVLLVAVIIGATSNLILQNLQYGHSFLVLVFIFLFTIVSQVGMISIFWVAGAHWPRATGALMLVLLIGIGIDFIQYPFNTSPGSFPDNSALRILFVSSLVLYSSACLMLIFAGRTEKTKAVSG